MGPQAYKSSARSTALSVLEASPATGLLRERDSPQWLDKVKAEKSARRIVVIA